MLQQLKPSTSYTHSGNIFSKILLLQNCISTENILHIVSDSQIQKKYSIVAQELGVPYNSAHSYHDIVSIQNGKSQILSMTTDDLSIKVDMGKIYSPPTLQKGAQISMEQTVELLQKQHYEYHEYEKPGTYIRKGDIITMCLPDNRNVQISFWGDEIESIEQNGTSITEIRIGSLEILRGEHTGGVDLLQSFLENSDIFCVYDEIEFHESYETLLSLSSRNASFDILPYGNNERNVIDLHIGPVYIHSLEDLKTILGKTKKTSHIYTRHTKVINEFLRDNSFSHIKVHSVSTHLLMSFSIPSGDLYICDDVLSKIFIKKRVKKKLSHDVDLLLKIQNGDYVVHIDHGIGIFTGIINKRLPSSERKTTKTENFIEKEYMEIQYEKNDKLFVPITDVHRVTKYVGSENPTLTPLSGKMWEKKMKKVHEDIREIAESILKNFAERKLRTGGKNILDSKLLESFQRGFPYPYTDDQIQTINDIFRDLESKKNMDRLLVGDVGFGKTEVAFNAAYASLLNKKQVLFISPLVVLAHEHFQKAKERFKDLPYNIEILTRLQSQKHTTKVLKGLKDGSIDIVIGTHKLLSDSISCKNLGIMIVDEEHKFGVVDKEKIKNIKSDIDILSLSATPIPRSLNLALSGVRDISLLKTPPSGRKSIETSTIRYNEKVIGDAGKREFQRGGQVFFVHNRVSNIEAVKKKLEGIFPKKKIVITHGQLPGEELENRIIDFKNKKYDVLLSTTVIENGIDFSNVNTIFINDCQSFGISQIHQLRGRVGRSHAQGYCYLLYKKEHLDSEAAKRIQTIVDYSYLGAGFELAMKDLEIRGGGDILGIRQSGQAREIGVSLFLKMLEEKIEELKEQKNGGTKKDYYSKNTQRPTIDLMISLGIPDEYFLGETDKLNFYREIELVENMEDLEYLKNSFFENSIHSEIPREAENLFLLIEAQVIAKKFRIQSIKKIGIYYQIDFHTDITLEELKEFLKRDKEVVFSVINASRLRSPTKCFANDYLFIKYLLQLLQGKVEGKKIKLVKRKQNTT